MTLFTPQSPRGTSFNQSGSTPATFDTGAPNPRPGRQIVATALAVFALGGAGFALIRATTGDYASETAAHTVVVTPPAAPAFSGSEVKTAADRACKAWDTASLAIADASRTSAAAPADWDNPVTKAADAAAARVTLTQIAYLQTQVTEAAPVELRRNISKYQDLSIAIEHAGVQRLTSVNNQLVAEQSTLNRSIESQCGLQ